MTTSTQTRQYEVTPELIADALSYISPDCSRDEWIAVGFAIHAQDPNFFYLWDSWSSGSLTKYPGSRSLELQWSKMDDTKGTQVGALFAIAKQYGFKFPTQNTPPKPVDNQKIEEFRRRQIQRLRDESEQYSKGLSVSERNANIKLLSRFCGLSPHHRKQLLDRGLNDDWINYGLFFTVTKGQVLPSQISPKLPGIENGRMVASSGLACVTFDSSHQATGFQIRNDNPEAKDKYKWAKGLFSSHLQHGELPLTHIRSHDTVFLCEGTLKPFVAAAKHGIAVIGASGGQFKASSLQLTMTLSQYNAKNVILSPDAGDVQSNGIMNRWKAIADLLGIRYHVYVAWWGQSQKKIDPDIDELPDLSNIEYLTVNDFFKKAN